MKFLSMKEICAMFGVSRSTIKRWVGEGGFPQAVQLGCVKSSRLANGRTKRSNCHIGFVSVEVVAWAQTRMEARLPPEEVE